MTTLRIPFTCTLDCGSRCELIAEVVNGEVVRIDTPAREDTDSRPRLIPCVRGRAHRRLLAAEERARYPLVRSGPRGSGQFQRVSWDQALDLVALHLRNALSTGGPASILHATGAGAVSGRGLHGASASTRFFSYFAPVTEISGNMSVHNTMVAQRWMLGRHVSGSDRAMLLHSKLILLWGHNPADTHMGPNTAHYVAEARDRGARVILIDPRLSDTGALCDHWVPLRPGTDAALAAAMAYTMFAEGLADTAFLERAVSGHELYRRNLFGVGGTGTKTPEWAEGITGVPAGTIRWLARLYATQRPAALLAGWGPQRTRYGEQAARALIALGCTSGNVGLRGGGLGGNGTRTSNLFRLPSLPAGPFRPARFLPPGSWAQAVLEGQLDPPPAVLYAVATNLVNRSQASVDCLQALERIPFTVAQDPFLTPTALHADVVLPVAMEMERPDIVGSWGYDAHLFDSRQAIAPRGEARSDYWIMAQLARRMGFEEAYTQGRNEEGWLQAVREQSDLPWETLNREGVLRSDPEPREEFETYRQDPAGHPLDTRSGRIEFANPEALQVGLPLLPEYVPLPPAPEGFPLQLLTPHARTRANSCLAANPWLQRVEPHVVWINAADARDLGVQSGEQVLVRSPRGVIRIAAFVTERIMPGVVSIAQGTWIRLDQEGIDVGGSANTLTDSALSPSGGPTTHSNWVRVEPIHE
ncbi:MAG: molybdopterin-dependent oxidoreductase [Chloroflexi bacterium]|nr:molybdopterin-dependent oxidoreductase [Chloroflexota bacterium]